MQENEMFHILCFAQAQIKDADENIIFIKIVQKWGIVRKKQRRNGEVHGRPDEA